MKINRKKRIVIALSALVVAASVAIPIGIVYGLNKTTSVAAQPALIVINKQDALPEAYVFGTDKDSIKVPELAAEGYNANPADYEMGTADTSSITAATKVGEKATTVTFTYKPKNGVSGPTYKIIYPLNTVKGKPGKGFGTNNDGIVEESKTVQYGATTDEIEAALEGGLDKWLIKNGYQAYKLADTDAKEYYAADGKSKISETDRASLNVGSTFVGSYKFVLNEDQFETKTANDVEVSKTGTLTVTYTVIERLEQNYGEILAPSDELTLEYKKNFELPVPGPDALKPHFVLSSPNPVTSVVKKPVGATNTPEVGMPIDPAKVMAYEVGTIFKVTFTYKVQTNYKAEDYTYVYIYTIGKQKLTTPTIPELALQPVEFGKQSTIQPSTAPSTFPFFTGFKAEFDQENSVVTQASSITAYGAYISPQKDEKIDTTKLNLYNSGTKYILAYKYVPVDDTNYEYTGETVVVKQEYEVVKQKVAFSPYEIKALDQTSYGYGADPAALNAPTPPEGVSVSTIPTYYAGSTKPADGAAPLTVADVKALPADQTFIAEWTATLDTNNYAPASSDDTTYKIAIPYKVGALSASYTNGSTTYGQAAIKYGEDVPSDFYPAGGAPEENKNIGYEYQAPFEFKVVTKATDGSGPEIGAVVPTAQIKDLKAGTVLDAHFYFVPKTNYSGPRLDFTKRLTIGKKQVVQPTAPVAQAVSLKWSESTPQPTNAPTPPEGYKNGTYTSAVFTKPAKNGSPALTDTVDWAKIGTYGAQTEITVTWTYAPDSDNYEKTDGTALTNLTTTQKYTILPADTVKPTGLAVRETNKYLAADVIAYSQAKTTGPNAIPFPSATTGTTLGTGYKAPTLESVLVSASKGNNTPAAGTSVTGWDQANKFEKDSEFEATYKYVPDDNHVGDIIYYIVTYRSESTVAVKPTAQDIVTNDGGKTYKPTAAYTYVYGSIPTDLDFPSATNLPNLGTTGYKGVLDSVTVTVSKGPNSPIGQPVTDWTQAKDFEIGAEFAATFTYTADTANGYTGDAFKYIQTYRSTAKMAVMPTGPQYDTTVPGKIRLVAPIVYSPDAPPADNASTPPPSLGTGYVGQFKSNTISKAGSNSPANGQPVPKWTDAANYEAGTEFEATYTYTPDAANNYDGVPFDYVQTYRIGPKKAIKPSGANFIESPANVIRPATKTSFTYGSAPVNPDVTPTLGTGYEGTRVSNKITIKGGPNTPDAGDAIPTSWDEVKKYDAGTEIESTFTYAVKPGYTGDPFTFIITYHIDKKAAPVVTQAAKNAAAVEKSVEFGKWNTATPFDAPVVFEGYKPVLDKIEVSTKSNFDGVSADFVSPDKGTPIVAPYDNLNKYNANTVIATYYTYTLDPNYSGTEQSFQIVKQYRIVPQKLTNFAQETYWTGAPLTYSKANDNISKITPPDYDPKTTYFIPAGSIWYYGPSVPGAYRTKPITNINDIPAQSKVGDTITVTYRFWFAPTNNSHNFVGIAANGAQFTTFIMEKTFTVVA